MKKYLALIRCILFIILLAFSSLLISKSTVSLKSDYLIEKHNFTYIPFVFIYIILLFASFLYDLITKKNIKELISFIICMILSVILFIIGQINMKYSLQYCFKYMFTIINVDYFIYTFVLIVKYLVSRDKDILK